jgi:hypothetical protein
MTAKHKGGNEIKSCSKLDILGSSDSLHEPFIVSSENP